MLCKLHLYGRAIHLRIFCALIIYIALFLLFICWKHSNSLLLHKFSVICFTTPQCWMLTFTFPPGSWCCPRPCEEPGICSLCLPPSCRWQIISLVLKCHAVPGSWRDARQEDRRQWLHRWGQQHQLQGGQGLRQPSWGGQCKFQQTKSKCFADIL